MRRPRSNPDGASLFSVRLGEAFLRSLFGYAIFCRPPRYGRSTSGTVTEPSAFW